MMRYWIVRHSCVTAKTRRLYEAGTYYANSTCAHMFQYQLDARGHRGSRAVERLVEYAPASGGLALWMQHRDVHQAPARAHWVKTNRSQWLVGNDGISIFYGPGFTNRSLQEQTGLLAHQVLHVALRHVTRLQALQARQGSIDSELFTVCADAIVNSSLSHLSWLTLPKGSLMLDTLLLRVLGIEQPVDVSLQRWDCETLYRAIDDGDSGATRSSAKSGSHRNSSSPADTKRPATQPSSANQPSDSLKPSEQSHHTGSQCSTQQQITYKADGHKAKAARELAATIIRDLIQNDALHAMAATTHQSARCRSGTILDASTTG